MRFVISSVIIFAIHTLAAQSTICRSWYTDGNASTVSIYKAEDGTYCGKITWMKEGFKNGKPLLDTQNPDASKRNNTWLGLQIIAGLKQKSATEYVGGKIYDPSKGNYYSCKMTLTGNNKLALRGYILGMPFLGRTTIWTLVEERDVPYTPPSISQPDVRP